MSTIRQRLTWRLLVGWSLMLVTGAVVAWLTACSALTRQFDDTLRTKALAVASLIEQDSSGIQVDIGDEFLREFEAGSRGGYFQVWRTDGSEVARSDSLQETSLQRPEVTPPNEVFWNVEFSGSQWVRAIGIRFKPHPADEAQKAGANAEAILAVALDRHELDRSLATIALVLTSSAVLVLALTAVMTPWLLRRELSPLDRLAEQAQRINAESLNERFSTEGLPGELAPISARLNDLLERLQAAFARERRFSDDLAHEFRTPIAELRSLAELFLKWPEARNPERDRIVVMFAQQMEAIISRLLAIARNGQGRAVIEPQRVQVAELVTAVCKPLEGRAADRKLTLEAQVPAALEIRSDPVLLRSIVTNLVDNAVEYSTPQGRVQIRSEQQNGHFSLQVSNPVQQLTAQDVPHLFERFWRKDAARAGAEHAGLGLSLARAFATSLGYTLSAELNGDSRLTMTLSGPVKVKSESKGKINP